MPKDRNKTYGDRQAEQARQKKQAEKEGTTKHEENEGAPDPKSEKSNS